ncbi:MAG: NAD-dependent protein deacylase [Clostridioides sp.]|nr:NAD-dependent protein deacylase [Clostridioides sp.]
MCESNNKLENNNFNSVEKCSDIESEKISTLEKSIYQLADMIKNAKKAVFLGGAGVSTESGIPDFRSENGLYSAKQIYGYSPEQLLSYSFFERKPELFFKYYKENLIALDAKPNKAHFALAELEKRNILKAVITQNIDGLHQMAGSENVLELHGSNFRQYCMVCHKKYPLEYVLSDENSKKGVPRCEVCGGIVRPDVVMYEEALDSEIISKSINAIANADLMIVGGTSLCVYPAAGLIDYFRGENLVLINKSKTSYDEQADLIISQPIGETLSKVLEIIK